MSHYRNPNPKRRTKLEIATMLTLFLSDAGVGVVGWLLLVGTALGKKIDVSEPFFVTYLICAGITVSFSIYNFRWSSLAFSKKELLIYIAALALVLFNLLMVCGLSIPATTWQQSLTGLLWPSELSQLQNWLLLPAKIYVLAIAAHGLAITRHYV